MLDRDQLISVLKKEIKAVGSQKAYAFKHGVSQQYLSDVLNKRRIPGTKILNALGYESVEMYKKIYHGNGVERSACVYE